MKRIIVGCDHVAYTLKMAVVEHLRARGCEVIDLGTDSPDVVVDYLDYAHRLAQHVSAGRADGGIVMCGTGLGVSIAANKVAGARAALCHDTYTAHQARAHNDANILAMGAYVVSEQRMPGIVDEWLDTPFEGGRHIARVARLDRHIGQAPEKSLSPDLCGCQFALALSARKSVFGPLLFAGRLEDGFAQLAAAGFSAVELSLRCAEDFPAEVWKPVLQKFGLQVTALATGQSCLHDQLCFASADVNLYHQVVLRVKSIIALAAELGADVIFGGVRGCLTGSPEEQKRQYEQALEGFQLCDRFAEVHNVRLLVEPINRYETNFLNNAQEALQFLDRAGSKTGKILLDTFHMNIEEVDIPTTLRMVGDRLGYLHIADSNRLAPGQGHFDFASVFSTLAEIGYRGPISAEILPVPDDPSAVLRMANFLANFGLFQPAQSSTALTPH